MQGRRRTNLSENSASILLHSLNFREVCRKKESSDKKIDIEKELRLLKESTKALSKSNKEESKQLKWSKADEEKVRRARERIKLKKEVEDYKESLEEKEKNEAETLNKLLKERIRKQTEREKLRRFEELNRWKEAEVSKQKEKLKQVFELEEEKSKVVQYQMKERKKDIKTYLSSLSENRKQSVSEENKMKTQILSAPKKKEKAKLLESAYQVDFPDETKRKKVKRRKKLTTKAYLKGSNVVSDEDVERFARKILSENSRTFLKENKDELKSREEKEESFVDMQDEKKIENPSLSEAIGKQKEIVESIDSWYVKKLREIEEA